ncbi:MAG: histidine phosphatase family protein [Pseudomonadota bacterium]
MACTLVLMRHGEIKANRRRRWHGATDSPLLWRGRRQARALGRYAARRYARLEALYVSPLQRCQATAGPLSERLGLPIRTETGLAEWDVGAFEDMPFAELAEREDFFNRVLEDPDYAPPGGESLNAVSARLTATLAKIARAHSYPDFDSCVGVVGHGAAFQVALAALIDETPKRWQSYQIANCSITELLLDPEPYVEAYNHTHFL